MARLQKSIRSGRFASYTQQKKWQIWNRLCRYARQLGIKIKAPVAAACLAAGLSFATPAAAQTFIIKTGADNPLDGVIFGNSSSPAFVDIDGDGDKDVFVGDYSGTISYYKNTGTAAAPVFTEQTGAANPLNGVDVGVYSTPAFVDIDGDGDMDVFIGVNDGTVKYYKNTGTAAAPVFAEQTGPTNPFNALSVAGFAAPSFVDIDGDGDKDAFIGEFYGSTISYYKNTGTTTNPVFVLQTGTDNPFNGQLVGYFATPTFADIDGDGDLDAFTGEQYGSIIYYKNTGTATAPVFALQPGTANPLSDVAVGYYSAPAFVDIDGDGDLDVFIGAQNGTLTYYQNTTIVLPLHLLGFSGSRKAGYNELQWQTAGEINTKWFDIEMSSDAHNFSRIATIKATGSGSNNYSIKDNAVYNGKVFYRLKMIDTDGRFTYSQVIWINSEQAGVSIYPNPVKDILNINIGSARILKTNAGIFDGNGRLLQNILINNNQQQINLQPLAKGRYIIKFADGTVQSFIKD